MKAALEDCAARLGLFDIDVTLDKLALRAASEKWIYERFLKEALIHQCKMADKRNCETLLKFAGFLAVNPLIISISLSKSPSQDALSTSLQNAHSLEGMKISSS